MIDIKFGQQAERCTAMFTMLQKCPEEAIKVQHKLLLATSKLKSENTKKVLKTKNYWVEQIEKLKRKKYQRGKFKKLNDNSAT